MMFPKITKDFLRTNNFKSDGLHFDEEIYFRPRQGVKLPPTAAENNAKLRKKIIDIFTEHYKNNFVKLENNCAINENTMRKYLKGTRKITREALSKFCVGTKLNLEQSAELFTLQGHSLEPETQYFDALVVMALQDGDSIEIFYETCEEYNIKIF